MMHRFKQKFILTAAFFTVFLMWYYSIFFPKYGESEDILSPFENFDNVNGSAAVIVPNIVHYVVFGINDINFITFLSMTSVLKIQRPATIFIHTDMENFSGIYWDLVQNLAERRKTKIEVMPIKRPSHVFGQLLSSVYHMTDVARIIVLMNFGGIYLDTDTLVLQSLDTFLKYEMVVGWPKKENIGTQILISHKDARFLKFWLDGYRRYQPRNWYYNAGQYPVELLSEKPELAHREDTLLGVQNLIKNLYVDEKWEGWDRFYSIHLLSRHHPDPMKLDEYSIKSYRHPFGEIASWLLYKVEPILITNGTKHWEF